MTQTQIRTVEDSRDFGLSEGSDEMRIGDLAATSVPEEVTARNEFAGGRAYVYLSRPADSREGITVSVYALNAENVWGESYKERRGLNA